MLKLKKQEIKDLVAVSYKFLKEIASKHEAESKRRYVFFIWFWIVFYPFWLYIKIREGWGEGGGDVCLTDGNLLCMAKFMCSQSVKSLLILTKKY